MRWSFSFARIVGIDIRVHATFPLVLFLGALQWGGRYGREGATFGVLLTTLLFVCVVLHELGHSLVARGFGVPVREIVLLPIGGVAKLEKSPEKPLHELLIALAGPAVNFVIAGVLFFVLRLAPNAAALDGASLIRPDGASPGLQSMVYWLLSANIALGVFNLIPALPLDGGRVLRSALAMVIGTRKATTISSIVAQVVATGLGVFGVLSGNAMLALVAFFVFMGAGRERSLGHAQSVLKTLRVGDAYNKYALALSPGDHVSTVIDYILTSYQPDYAVLHGGDIIGVVTRDEVLRALASDPRDLYVGGVMQRDVPRVSSSLTLEDVRQHMSETKRRVVAVCDGVDNRHYLGLVSLEDIQEALLVASYVERQEALRRAEAAGT